MKYILSNGGQNVPPFFINFLKKIDVFLRNKFEKMKIK